MQLFFVDAEGPSGGAQVLSYVVATPKSVDAIIMSVGGCGMTKNHGPVARRVLWPREEDRSCRSDSSIGDFHPETGELHQRNVLKRVSPLVWSGIADTTRCTSRDPHRSRRKLIDVRRHNQAIAYPLSAPQQAEVPTSSELGRLVNLMRPDNHLETADATGLRAGLARSREPAVAGRSPHPLGALLEFAGGPRFAIQLGLPKRV